MASRRPAGAGRIGAEQRVMFKVERRRGGVINHVRADAEGFYHMKTKRGYVKQTNQLAFPVEAREKKDTMAAPSRATLIICYTVCCDMNSHHQWLLWIQSKFTFWRWWGLPVSSAVPPDSYFRFGTWNPCTFLRNPIWKPQHVHPRFHLSHVNRVEL